MDASGKAFRFTEFVSSPRMKNISLYQKGKSVLESARLTRPEGRIMIVTNARWDAVDAAVPITNGADAYGEGVWS